MSLEYDRCFKSNLDHLLAHWKDHQEIAPYLFDWLLGANDDDMVRLAWCLGTNTYLSVIESVNLWNSITALKEGVSCELMEEGVVIHQEILRGKKHLRIRTVI